MAPPSLGTSPQRPSFRPENVVSLPSWAHDEVRYWWGEWRTIRDTCEGERVVKDAGTTYLPCLEGMEGDEYEAYKTRAVFYSFTGKTASAMAGAIFRRAEQIEGLSERLEENLSSFSKFGVSFKGVSLETATEVIKMGRYGLLLDLPSVPTPEPRPYVVGYTAENILDWDYTEVKGRMELTRVVLCELEEYRSSPDAAREYKPFYRELILVNGVYTQRIYRDLTGAKEKTFGKKLAPIPEFLSETIVPMNRGRTLAYLPFRLFGPTLSDGKVQKPPLNEIARLNISHYISYANLEHGRFFVGFPIYHVSAPPGSGEEEGDDFRIGASRVWVTAPEAKPGIIEMNGQGLKFLSDALDQKEQQAAALGGRIMGIRGQAVSESDNQLKISERNEQSVLLQVTLALDAGMTQVVQWWAQLQDVSKEEAKKILVEFNKDFLFDGVGAREFRAVHAMYKDGVIPIDIVYHYLRKASVIPDWMKLDEFRKLLDKMESFPNNPDIEAQREGFADAKGRDKMALQDDQQEFEAGQMDKDRKAAEKVTKDQMTFDKQQADLDRKSAEKTAKDRAKVAAATKPAVKPAAKKPVA